MRCLIILTFLILVNLNLCGINKQTVVAVSVTPATTLYTITGTNNNDRFYDNVIAYTIKYFDSSDTWTPSTGQKSQQIGEATYLYSFDRDASGTTYISSIEYTDSNNNSGVVTSTSRFVKYYSILYKNKPVDYAYTAFNIIPDCDNQATPVLAAIKNSPPRIKFNAKFFCSDEEALAEYNSLISGANALGVGGSVAYISTSGVCKSPLDTDDYSSILNNPVTVCNLLEGYDTNTDAYCKP